MGPVNSEKAAFFARYSNIPGKYCYTPATISTERTFSAV
jgi:hypothetical protein